MKNIASIAQTGPIVFIDFAHNYGGSRQSTVLLVRELRRLMTEVVVIDAYGTCDEYISDLKRVGVTPILLSPNWSGKATIGGRKGIQRLGKMFFSIPNMVQLASRLREVLRDVRPRAICMNTSKSLFVTWLAAPRDIPVIFYVRSERRSIRPYNTFAWRRVNAAIGLSENTLQYLRSTSYAHGNLYVVYNGCDVDTTLDRAKVETKDIPFVNAKALKLIIPASLIVAKGHEFGIRAIAKFIEAGEQAHLWICGDVPPGAPEEYYQKLKQLTVELGMQQNVHFLGWRNDIPAVMAKSDVVFLPTSHPEGIPRSLLEAMSVAKPIITTRAGGIPELLRDGIDGLLVEQGDVEAMVEAMKIFRDPNVREQIGQSGQCRARTNFSIKRQAEQFQNVVDSLVNTKSQVW